MPNNQQKRKLLLGKLSRGLIYTTPMLIAAVGYGQATSDAAVAAESYELVAAQSEAEAKKKKQAKSEAKGEAEAKSEAKGEAEAKKKGKSEAKGEAEAKKKGKSEAKGEAEAKKKGKSEAKGEAEAEAEGEAEGDKKLITRSRRDPKRFKGKRAALEARGKELFDDTSLSTNEMSCNSCHADFLSYNDSFKKSYPHRVDMGKDMFGLRKTSAEQMVQMCMVVPMEAKPLPWNSEELVALTAYVKVLQKEYKKK